MTLKDQLELIDDGIDEAETAEIALNTSEQSVDFIVYGYRFIMAECIDDIMTDELSADDYILGCCDPVFLANVTPLSETIVRIVQETDRCDELGKQLISMGCLKDIQQGIADVDGYGLHFAAYDGEEHVIDTDGGKYYVFRLD